MAQTLSFEGKTYSIDHVIDAIKQVGNVAYRQQCTNIVDMCNVLFTRCQEEQSKIKPLWLED